MKKNIKGGLEGIIAIVIITSLIVALIFAVVIPMADQGDKLIDTTTSKMVDHNEKIGPGV